MEKQVKPKFEAIAFDLDGTLYPNFSFYWRAAPSVIKNLKFFRAFNSARGRLHREAEDETVSYYDAGPGSFYDKQGRYVGEALKRDPGEMRDAIERIIYRGWEPLYKKVKLFPHALDVLKEFRQMGIKTALLSDFPPEAKIEYLGLSGLWDAVLCTEELGCLKPHPYPFVKTAEAIGYAPSEMLYVGNSFPFDVLGAQKAGMKAAWIRSHRGSKDRKADFAFSDYRQLRDYVLT